MITLDLALRTSACIAAGAAMLTAAEYIALNRAGVFAAGGLLDWEILATVRRWTMVGRPADLLVSVFGPKRFRLLPPIQLVLAVSIGLGAATGNHSVVGLSCAGCFVVGLLWAVRHPFGRDGADEMLLLLLLSLAVAFLAPSPTIRLLAVAFVCAQLMLSYVVAGVAKVGSRAWMRTGVMGGILSTEIYGRQRTLGAWFRRHPRFDVLCSVGVVLMEVGYPAVFVLPDMFAVMYVAVTIVFHFATAVLMGLYTFAIVFTGSAVLMLWLVTWS